MLPHYRIPIDLLFDLMGDGLRGRGRDISADAQAFRDSTQPPPRALGKECIPARGPFLLVINHYSRPGFAVWWLAAAVSSFLSMPHTWIMSSEWTAPGRWYEPLKRGIYVPVFRRLAEMYGLILMPPMPPRPQDVEKRAGAVRAALAYVEDRPEAVICLAPEGRDMPGGVLGWPPSGVGRFISLLAARGLPLLPAGGWEEDGELLLRFGPPFRLEPPPAGMKDREARDRLIAQTVMKNIGRLLPETLRGEFL